MIYFWQLCFFSAQFFCCYKDEGRQKFKWTCFDAYDDLCPQKCKVSGL